MTKGHAFEFPVRLSARLAFFKYFYLFIFCRKKWSGWSNKVNKQFVSLKGYSNYSNACCWWRTWFALKNGKIWMKERKKQREVHLPEGRGSATLWPVEGRAAPQKPRPTPTKCRVSHTQTHIRTPHVRSRRDPWPLSGGVATQLRLCGQTPLVRTRTSKAPLAAVKRWFSSSPTLKGQFGFCSKGYVFFHSK